MTQKERPSLTKSNEAELKQDTPHSLLSTGEPLLSGHPLSGHTLLGGQLSKSQKYPQYNTVNKTFIWRPPLLRGRGHLLAIPMRVFLLFLPLFSGQQEYKVQSLAFFQPFLDR